MLLSRTNLGGIVRLIPLALLAALIAWALLPWPLVYRWSDPEVTSVMQYRLRESAEKDEPLDIRQIWVPLDDVPSVVVRAVIEAEDGRFREHGGIDWTALGEELQYGGEAPFSWFDLGDLKAVWEAARYGWSHRSEVRGRSTITQQLAKNLYFTPERTIGRKVAEYVVAWRLEWLLGKDRILEIYLNTVELGPGIFGVGAAAEEYFGTSVGGLGAWEAASLAATLPHPLTSNPKHGPAQMAWRRDLILRRLTRSGPSRPEIPPLPAEPPPPNPTWSGQAPSSPDEGGAPEDTSGIRP